MVIEYFFKKKTKYPERVYLFYGRFLPRNRRPMGLMYEFPFFRRTAMQSEIASSNAWYRQQYYQYENWTGLVEDEIRTGVPMEIIVAVLKVAQKEKFHLSGEHITDIERLMTIAQKRIDSELPSGKQVPLFNEDVIKSMVDLENSKKNNKGKLIKKKKVIVDNTQQMTLF